MIIKLNSDRTDKKICTTIKQLLIMVKTILYKGTTVMVISTDFTKGLGRYEP